MNEIALKQQEASCSNGTDNLNFSGSLQSVVTNSGNTNRIIQTVDAEMNNFDIGFSNRTIRQGFIRRVYFVLTLQLMVTVGIICCFVFIEKLKKFVQRYWEVYIASVIIFFVLYILLACCKDLRRKVPINILLLTMFTLSMSAVAGIGSCYYNSNVVLTSTIICTACCFVVSIFSIQTKIDFTPSIWVVCIIGLVVLFFGFSCIIFYDRIMVSVYSGLSAFVFMIILAIDTQRIIGGGKKYNLNPEEYIAGALFLYVDVVQIFMFLLDIRSTSS